MIPMALSCHQLTLRGSMSVALQQLPDAKPADLQPQQIPQTPVWTQLIAADSVQPPLAELAGQPAPGGAL